MFRYPGGKKKLRNDILCQLDQYRGYQEYREPFFGAGSIGLAFLEKKPPGKTIWLNDKDPGIADFWTSVIQNRQGLKNLIKSFIPSVEKFYEFKHKLMLQNDNIDPVEHGFMKLAIHQISYSGLGVMSGGPLGGKSQNSPYPIDCRWNSDLLCKHIDIIYDSLNRFHIFGCSCTPYDFEEVITAKGNALLYLDPPYYEKGKELYQYSFTIDDHKKLCYILQITKNKWVLSYDNCTEVREMYQGWAEMEATPALAYTINTSRRKSELLIRSKDYGSYY